MNQQQSICSQAREKTRAKRAATQVFSFLTLRAAAFVNCAALVIACVFLFVNGIGALNIDFVLDSPREMMTSGGVFPCLVGTFLLAAGAIAIALPFGVASKVLWSISFVCRWLTSQASPRSCSACSVWHSS